MTVTEAYDLMGLKRPSTIKEIKSRFRELAKKTHPDACGEENDGHRFQQVYNAYETILESLGEPRGIEWFFKQEKMRRVTVDEDPFEIRHENYWMPKIKKMLENMEKYKEKE